MTMADGATPRVRDFYNTFPYPPDPLQDGPPPGYNWRWCYATAYSHCTGRAPDPSQPLHVLDAGCGSGVSSDYLVHLNPEAQVTALDISPKALAVARERLRRSGGEQRIHFHCMSLLEAPSLGRFQLINSVGVLHHMADPATGLAALAMALADGGILHLFLYADGGRWEIHRTQHALRLLGVQADGAGVRFARQLIAQLPEHNSILQRHQQRWSLDTVGDAAFADMYLHPQETSYTLERLFRLVEGCGLRFLGFSNPRIWRLDTLLQGEALERAKALPDRQQWQLVEALNTDISHFEFFLGKLPLPSHTWSCDEDLLTATAQRNPCLWGWPGSRLLDPDLEPMDLDQEDVNLLKAIDAAPLQPLRHLLDADDGRSRMRLGEQIRALWQRRLALLRPTIH
ncbi:MAG: SAM-dependent methlyltransferase [Candidatus Synechococcus spongiarum SP3]|uniref:SAM-dependent methlyltransferase n=1 Tax=Candidatus Synechococcus spongiarum SP3 TaxID=1604020 RepID=A0A0G2HP91_9SYNE|nr:MAG: SAM-dependent methlyltransferase [Candidatus Synechococcus spongiarum SP3]